MRLLPFFPLLLLAASAISACDAHDYWLITDKIEVNSDEEILSSKNVEPLEQELFVRYQLDYEVENTGSQATEVVVSATSFVNHIERATAQKIWHLDAGENGQGILTTNQLQLGNSLEVSLKCCSQSQCSRNAVLCPETTESLPDSNGIAAFCYDACEDTTSCMRQCPSEESCQSRCQNTQDREKCHKEYCDYGGTAASCSFLCADKDESCYETCHPTESCANKCLSLQATCFRNCLSTWTQCTEDSYSAGEGDIPCALCDGEGTCKTDYSIPAEEDNYVLHSSDGQDYPCEPKCNEYPSACVSGCETLYEGDTERMRCLSRCLDQHLFWCNDYQIPTDYVDTNGKQPCCFTNYCSNSLTSVVKTYDVECFNDTSCSSGSSCSPEGICVSDGSSNCSGQPRSSHSSYIWLLMPVAVILLRRRRGRHA